MLAILNSLNGHNLPIFQTILMILVSKCMVHRALSDKTYLSLGLLSPLNISADEKSRRLLLRLAHKWVNRSNTVPGVTGIDERFSPLSGFLRLESTLPWTKT